MSCPVALPSQHTPEGQRFTNMPAALGWTVLVTGPVGGLARRFTLENGELSLREVNC